MIGNKRNFSLTIWDHEDNFLCVLKSADSDFEGQSYEENFVENINGEKTLTFSVPMYIFNYKEFIDEEEKIPNRNDKNNFVQNEAWRHIYNEQKIRYIEYNKETNEPDRIEEFVLKNYTESRNGEQKIATCTCESLAVYELGKIGWGITWDTDYVSNYDFQNIEDNLTLDYWMRKLLYKETNLGRVSSTTECTYLIQGIQLRNDEGYPISDTYSTINGKNEYVIIDEPICTTTNSDEYRKYENLTGWSWEIQAIDPRRLDTKISISTLYEEPVINKYIEVTPNYYKAFSYQKNIGVNDSEATLLPHPIAEVDYERLEYVTSIKRHLMTAERSNVFSIIQNLCEEFSIWAYFIYSYDNSGKIIERKILFKSEAIDEDIKFDFSYGKNLQSCSRILDSSDLITKLYVTNTDSALVDGSILSIQQATANPTGENYIYNFKYFYESGMLTKEENFGFNSDEYKINLHCGKLRNVNNKITNIQKYLSPLYSLQMELEGDLVVQEGAKTGYIDNIQSIEDKIAAIPPGDQYIKSWSADNTQYNHIGESKTFTITTQVELGECKYINFGRDDILVGQITTIDHYDPNSEQQISTTTLYGFAPRAFKYDKSWHAGDTAIGDNDTNHFIMLNNNETCRYDYSELGNNQFVKGIYFKTNYISTNYARLRYKYAPLAYYYLLILDYQNKIKQVNQKIQEIEQKLLDVENRILVYELELKNLLKDKNELILQFEKDYKPYIREGYWEPNDYKPESINKILYTDEIESNFDGFVTTTTALNEMRLNDSLNTYTRYCSLGNAIDIDIDSVNEMITYVPIGGTTTAVTRLKGLNFELYRSTEGKLLIAISPELIDRYETYGYDESLYEGTLTYKRINSSTTSTTTLHWLEIPNNVKVNDNYIYISDDNIITSNMKVYGGHSTDENNLLEQNTDWTYQYESAAYDSQGNRVSISTAYVDDIYYDYSIRIDLKLSNKVNQYLNNPKFTVSYDEETTLQYLYNDAILMSDKYAIPRSEYSISVVDLSSLNGFEYYKPKVGQLVPIWDVEMGLKNFEGFITSVSFPLEEKYNTQIEITTYNTKFEDIFQKLTATVTSIEYNEDELNRAADAFEVTTGAIKTDVFQKSLEDNFNRIQLGNNNEITIDRNTGITLRDADSNNGVKIIGNGIFLTEDINKPSENIQWKTGITGKGINANAITAGNIDTKQVNIWNASERQVRFVWNEQGLFAYGDKFGANNDPYTTTSITTEQDLIDYNKFVKFNQEGLDFTDHDKSALKLGWTGLRIQTQNESLNLNADKGLILQQWDQNHTTATTRLELGKLDDGTLYGLRLRGTDGNPTLQSDSLGDLWLHRNLQVGGSMNSNNVVQNATAGVYGLESSAPAKMQMGFRRGSDGTIFWDSTPIRFWAGRQDINSYTTNIHATSAEIASATKPSGYNTLQTGDPTFAKFKVSANGDILASGIDVGGWVGQGNSLRSNDFHAILRSNDYGSSGDGYPVLAIGKPNSGADTTYGSNYNFRVYKSGKLQIGGNNFIVDSAGNVTIKAGSINIGGINTSSSGTTVNGTVTGTVGGMTANANGLSFTSGNYTTAIYKIANSTSNAFVAGPTSNPTFKVSGNGILTASSAIISGKITATDGEIGGWKITSSRLYIGDGNNRVSIIPKGNSTTNDAVILIGNDTALTAAANVNTKFKVSSNGSVYFHGDIYGYNDSKGRFVKGLKLADVKLVTVDGNPISVEINNGLVIDIVNG